ncbi:MAG: hypothetical protein LQ337_004848 [Flavoplaca oasis]|nr:MAG: hypothetical protein LQ337_004848 [Flavoplaca oasis]
MRQAANLAAADEEHASFSSSEPLLKQDFCDADNSNDAINTWWPSTPDCLRWMTARLRFRRNQKPMRGHKTRGCARLGLGTLVFLGLIQLFSILGGLLIVFVPDRITDKWGRLGHIGQGLSSWPTDFSRGINPIPCHSHNDYWRRVPLYSAIEVGCISVEADVWLFDEELYIGHSLASLTPNRTLASLYVDPLVQILEKQNPTTRFHPDGNVSHNGVFDTAPEQSLTLLVDFKTSGSALFPHVLSALEPLRSRGYLTYRNGTHTIQRPITVIGTGNTPFSLVDNNLTNPYHDIFYDAPLAAMWEGLPGEILTPASKSESLVYGADIDASLPGSSASEDDMGQGISGAAQSPDAYTLENSVYASVSFAQAIGHVLSGKLSDPQMNLIRGHIRGAHRRGLKVRYWELPFWPIGLRNYVWDVLVKEGVDLLNVDDLKGATKTNWGSKAGWWS